MTNEVAEEDFDITTLIIPLFMLVMLMAVMSISSSITSTAAQV